MNRGRDRAPLVVCLSTATLTIVLWAGQFPLFDYLNNRWLDLMFQVRGMEHGDPRISVVAIDDLTLKRLPGFQAAALAKFLVHYGALVVGYDVLYLHPPASRQMEKDLIDATKVLGSRFVHATMADPDNPSEFFFERPFAGLAKVTKSLGAANQPFVDSDGMFRRTCNVIGTKKGSSKGWPTDPNPMPLLAVKVVSEFENWPIKNYLKQGNVFIINFRGSRGPEGQETFGIRRISAWRVIEGKLREDEEKAIRNGAVLVGYTAQGAGDFFPTPFSPRTPGVAIQAEIVDTILNRREIRRINPLVTLALIMMLTFAVILVIGLGPIQAVSAASFLAIAWCLAAYLLFLNHTLIDFSQPLLPFLGSFGGLYIRKTRHEAQTRKFLKKTFGQFVAPEVVADLLRKKGEVELGGEQKEMTVMFLDIANFTSISEHLDPKSLIVLLNRYLSRFSQAIHQQKGVVDKYIGDCVMAFWNAPLEQEDHHARGCLAALDCLEALRQLNAELDPKIGGKIAVRIGINSGPIVVGLTGSNEKLQYTVLGDEVNVASRLEGVNKFFGTCILIGEECYAGARKAVEGRELGCVRVVGKVAAVRVYEVLAKKGELSAQWKSVLPIYEAAIAQLKCGDFDGATVDFEKVLDTFPEDRPTLLLLEQIANRKGDCVFEMGSK